MLDVNDFLNAIKKAATDAVNTSQPCDFCFGKVVSTSPLKISIEQKLTLGIAQLVLTKNVTDYSVNITVDWDSEKSGEDLHTHKLQGVKKATIHNALKVGEEVILLKQKGGQKYLVLDRVVNA